MPRRMTDIRVHPKHMWTTSKFTGSGTYDDPIDVTVTGGGGETAGNTDGGTPASSYGGSVHVDGGDP